MHNLWRRGHPADRGAMRQSLPSASDVHAAPAWVDGVCSTPKPDIPKAIMYITDLTHFLDEKGAIQPQRGPAKAMADFHAAAVAHVTDGGRTGMPAPTCFKCKKAPVAPELAADGAIYWGCPRCKAEGRISNWENTLWDLRQGPEQRS